MGDETEKKLKHKVGLIRKATARKLGDRGDADAMPSLVDLLADPDNDVREEAARSLGKLGEEEAVTLLARVAEDDPNLNVRRAAQTAVGAIERAVKRREAGLPASVPHAPAPARRGPSARDELVKSALEGTGAVAQRTPFGYEVELPLGERKQRVQVIFESRDAEGDPLILVHTSCGVAREASLRWALRENFKLYHSHLALRRSGEEDRFVLCQTLLEPTTQPEELRKAVLSCAREGDRVEKALTAGRDEH